MLAQIKRRLPIGYLNYYRYVKQTISPHPFQAAGLSQIFNEIIRLNYWKGTDSICGSTSGIEETTRLRAGIQSVLRELSIRTVLDIPCGDFAWMKHVDFTGMQYTGADIVQDLIAENNRRYAAANVHFTCLDLTKSLLPAVDVIICRDCLLHLSFSHIHQALARIRESGSTWLLCTSFTRNKFNYNIRDGLWRTLNMQRKPFNLPPPELVIPDNQTLEKSVFRDKALCLWKISSI